MQLDIFVPQYKLAFEYQGIQHYDDHQFFGDLTAQKEKVISSLHPRLSLSSSLLFVYRLQINH